MRAAAAETPRQHTLQRVVEICVRDVNVASCASNKSHGASACFDTCHAANQTAKRPDPSALHFTSYACTRTTSRGAWKPSSHSEISHCFMPDGGPRGLLAELGTACWDIWRTSNREVHLFLLSLIGPLTGLSYSSSNRYPLPIDLHLLGPNTAVLWRPQSGTSRRNS